MIAMTISLICGFFMVLLDNVQDGNVDDDPDELLSLLAGPPGNALEPQDEGPEGEIASIKSSSQPPKECGKNDDISCIV
jgi:hypothetical protein